MRHAIMAMFGLSILHGAAARADGNDASPPWISRAMKIAVRIEVPERVDISAPEHHIGLQRGAGFFVGVEGQRAYLVTAGHVIWPDGIRDDEKVNLSIKIDLPECRASVPAVADGAHATSKATLDLALVTINLMDVPNDPVNPCKNVIGRLPRHILDPNADSLPQNARAWLIAPGVYYEGIDARPISGLEKPKEARLAKDNGATLQFTAAAFTPGDSGSPVFSEKGYLIGMAIEASNGKVTKYSMILRKLNKDWKIQAELAGSSASLIFSSEYRGSRLSIDGAPAVRLESSPPAPLGTKVPLKLWIEDTQEVTGTANVREGADVYCDVTISHWLARHKWAAASTTLGLIAITGVAFGAGKMSQSSFDQSPSRSSYDRVRLFNAIAVGAGSAALGSLVPTTLGYVWSETSAITCHEGRR